MRRRKKFLKPLTYAHHARNFLASALHRGRHLASAFDDAVRTAHGIYTTARPILAEAGNMYATPQKRQTMNRISAGVDKAASQYGRLRGEAQRASGLVERLGGATRGY